MANEIITVEVAYANNEKDIVVALQLSPDNTIYDAITASGILQQFPEIDLKIYKVGTFSKITTLEAKLKNGDRIEIYRPLKIDPKQKRLLKAKISKEKF